MLGRPIGRDISRARRSDWSESEREKAEEEGQDSSGVIKGLQ
jgi:hypothetical protein